MIFVASGQGACHMILGVGTGHEASFLLFLCIYFLWCLLGFLCVQYLHFSIFASKVMGAIGGLSLEKLRISQDFR